MTTPTEAAVIAAASAPVTAALLHRMPNAGLQVVVLALETELFLPMRFGCIP